MVSLAATIVVRPDTLAHYELHPLSFAIPVLVALSLAGMKFFTERRDELKAFLSSCLYLSIMLVGAAVGLYSTLLPSSSNAASDITVDKALSGPYATHVGIIWWSFGTLLALGYFCISYGMFRGKVSAHDDSYGH